jgi:hypothetical protein
MNDGKASRRVVALVIEGRDGFLAERALLGNRCIGVEERGSALHLWRVPTSQSKLTSIPFGDQALEGDEQLVKPASVVRAVRREGDRCRSYRREGGRHRRGELRL